jgi:lipoprotein-anchoring transpeptidase ErfK/SrfK
MPEPLVLPDRLERRQFLQLSAMSRLGLALPVRWRSRQVEAPGRQLGRVLEPTPDVFLRPSFAEPRLKSLRRDDVFVIRSAVLGDRVPEHNRVWYEADGLGYIHSSAVQPCREELNVPLADVPIRGLLMEVTVPFVDAHWKPASNSTFAYRFYYGSTHWINGVSQDVGRRKWYRVLDDKFTNSYYAPAEAFRQIPLAELVPISPSVPPGEKRIEVNLSQQWMQCYEGDQLVFTSRISSGRQFDQQPYWTPQGEFKTFRKRASRHMTSGNLAAGYDLPGVPWVAYITLNGVSFHGTYWHNDFGVPRSHGCINLASGAAKWLYRWTLPVVPAEEQEVWLNHGTRTKIYA